VDSAPDLTCINATQQTLWTDRQAIPKPCVAGSNPAEGASSRARRHQLRDAVSYDFAFGGTGNIRADCALDNGPVVVRQTTV